MSLQPLRITGGTKFATGLAGILTTMSVIIGWAVSALAFLPASTGESLISRFLFLALALLSAAAFVVVSHLLVRIGLGAHRTAGSLRRLFRYQLGALGSGAGLGLCMLPAMIQSTPTIDDAAPVWWAASIAAGIGLIAVSLLAFRGERRLPLTHPPHPGIGLTEGVVVDYWSGTLPRAAAPSLTVIRFADESGRIRFARHLVRRNPTVLGTMGQVQYDRRRPDRVLGFTNGRPPFAEHPPRTHRTDRTAPSPRRY